MLTGLRDFLPYFYISANIRKKILSIIMKDNLENKGIHAFPVLLRMYTKEDSMEDFQIIVLYFGRDEDAIRQTDGKYGGLLKGIAYNILSSHEDSEECVNDTYQRAWDSMPPKKPDSLRAYLGRITRNLSINRWHENHTGKRGGGAYVLLSELSDCVPSSRTVDREIEGSMLTDLIAGWLSKISDEDRVLFVRRYWYGDSLELLAQERGTTANRLSGRLFRMRGKLRDVLTREGVVL